MKYNNGNEYNGEWEDNKYNGFGTMSIKGVYKYIGFFKNNKREGEGMCTYESGEVYEGDWLNDEQHNQEVIISQNEEMLTTE